MLTLRLSEIAMWTKGRLVGADAVAAGVAIDTRRLVAGELYVALPGEHHDGHDFVAAAHSAGAVAALVARRIESDLAQIIVTDTQLALGDLASAVRAQHRARIVGITGSNGKTTVKTLTASILALHGRTHVNPGNLNNEIGLPLTVLRMPADTEFAVIEMGAGKPGDIAYLAEIARPHVGLVNNIAPAHLERMLSVEGVAETKGALYSTLPGDGVAIINADDAFAPMFTGLAGARRILRFGLDTPADVSARELRLGQHSRFVLSTPQGDASIELPLAGRHNVSNALAASAIALALEVPLATIRAGLEHVQPVAGRQLRQVTPSGWVLIDDSYNANPGSTAAAIATLALESGETWLVLGDMKELGADASQLHAQIGTLAKAAGIHKLWTVGDLSAAASRAFGRGAEHFHNQADLISALRRDLTADVRCLIKGSRSSGMDHVVAALLSAQGDSHAA